MTLTSRPVFAQADSPPTAQDEKARQLRIYQDSLLQGSTEEVRLDAAVGLLLRDDQPGRDVLLTALKADDNPAAQQAVCKALIKSRAVAQTITSRMIYLEPLVGILTSDNTDKAVLAAEALLLYTYDDLEESLEAIFQDQEASKQARLNAVYALQIRSEKKSLARLVGLLDNADVDISRAAENALQEAFGIPVGASRKVWDDILKKLEQKSPDDIRRELLLLKETRLRQIQAERDRWQKLYLDALDKQYETADEASGGKLIVEKLNADLSPVRLWALGKVVQYPVAGHESLRERLLVLLGDESREVRLQTAKVLNAMSALDPAEQLLKQLQKEQDFEVRLAMFEALGEACFFAFSPGSGIELSEDIKLQTLTIASQYLDSEQANAVKKGAEVIRKILELNNLSKESMQHYLQLLADRYRRSIEQDAGLRTELLTVMSHLCGQGAPRTQACKLYEEFFVEALTVADQPLLRLAAIKGMVYIDPAKAMKLAAEKQLMEDESLAVRQVVIDLAGQIGGPEDLSWLLTAMKNNGHVEDAWQTIKLICQRQKSEFLQKWITTADLYDRNEYAREILELAEQKAIGENNTEAMMSARRALIGWYRHRKLWDQGKGYLEKIQFTPDSEAFGAVLPDVVAIYLYAGEVEKACGILEKELKKGDFPADSALLTVLTTFLGDDGVSEASRKAFSDKLSGIKIENRPNWEKFKSDRAKLQSEAAAAASETSAAEPDAASESADSGVSQ